MQQQQQPQQQQQQQQQLTNPTVTQQQSSSLQFQLQQQQPTVALTTHTSQSQHQHQQQQQHHQHLTNNIIVVRGSRNEHGEIVIQNKQDIFTFLSEHHQQQQQLQQQQQQQQNEKATVATLTQLPATTTVARKTSISLLTNANGIVSGVANPGPGNTTVATVTSSSTSNVIPKESNTILLQTPINASQLETVLLQSGQLKKSNSTVSAATDRPFLFKNVSRKNEVRSVCIFYIVHLLTGF